MVPQHLVILLVKLAVSASLASILTRSGRFQRMLMREERTLVQRVQMALVCAAIFGAGVAVRVLNPDEAYQALDLGLEGSLVMGMLGGYVTGLLAGVLISIPAFLHGELMSMVLFAAVGVLGGLLRDLAPDKEAIWKFSPFPDLALWRLFRKRDLRLPAFSLGCVLVILLAEALRWTVAAVFHRNGVFALESWADASPGMIVAIFATTLFSTVLPIKVWNSSRNEKKLEQQQLHLNEARLAALSRQINPHFLFNTLNSVASLIRIDPDQARQVIYKLSKILRRLLRQQENLTSLGEELSFIDDYLAIEMVRFGDKLRFIKDIDPATPDLLVPSMLLQPLVENSIRHGLSNKVDGGTIWVRSRMVGRRLQILVEDDGVGIPEAKLATLFEQGIGVNNVNERLKVLFGEDYKMWIDSRPGEGTSTGIEIPEQVSGTVVGVETLVGSG
ncbi:MAG: sensor histidine kinase [Bryobacteraceae bacterium]|jgi:two-component system LytT family sensor kinase